MSELDELKARVATLEEQLQATQGLLQSVTKALTAFAEAQGKELRTQALLLCDPRGEAVGGLATLDGRPGLFLGSPDAPSVAIVAGDDAVALMLARGDDSVNAGLSDQGATVNLFSGQQEVQVVLKHDAAAPTLVVSGADGEPRGDLDKRGE